MLSWIKAGWTIAGFPVRAAWKGYSALWWAFEDDAPRVADPASKRPAAAAESSTPNSATPAGFVPASPEAKPLAPTAKPVKALKKGFVATLVTSAIGAWAMAAASDAGNLSDPQAVLGGFWIAGVACVASLFLVRRSERQRMRREAAPTAINTVKRGLRQAVAAVREHGAAVACGARAKAARVAAHAGFDRLVR